MPKKLLVLIMVAILAVIAGACGSSEDGGSSGQRPEPDGTNAGANAGAESGSAVRAEKPTAVETVQVAYRETAAEQTAKTTFEMTMTGPSTGPENTGQPAPMTMTGEGAVDFSGQASIISMRMAGMGTMEVRQVGNVVYTKMPEEFAAQTPGGKPWVALDVEELYGQSGGGLGEMQGGAASDPTRQLEYLRGVSDSVAKVGTDTVRGVQTTRYEATIDVKKLIVELDGEAPEEYEKAMRQAGMEEMPVEIWLDDQNRVRRYAMDMKMNLPGDESGASQGNGVRMQMVSEYFDFGTAVDVQAPPQDQTMDGSQLMSSQAPA